MLASTPNPTRTALNRLTFGARDLDVTRVEGIGLSAWLAEQFAVPSGDDPDLAAHIASQTMRIKYPAADASSPGGTWTAVDEMRPLNYLNADTPTLWDITTKGGTKYSYPERERIRTELIAAIWLRNTHSSFQLREFMTDFWLNHFNIGKNENQFGTDTLPVFYRTVIRPRVFGNFRALLEATANTSSMLLYLDNGASTAARPNENYAREIIELHTMGRSSYLGVAPPAGGITVLPNGVADNFTDVDVVQASRALSGWTLKRAQWIGGNNFAVDTGEFFYNAAQHNTTAGTFMNVDLSTLTADMAQGRKVIETIAWHPKTARFIVNKLCVRIFGDNPPAAAVQRGIVAWKNNIWDAQQIQKVLEAIVLGGPEISTAPIAKVRRPYERLIAFARTTDTVVNASVNMANVFDPVNDGPFAWGGPDGRPDANAYWLSTSATLNSWNQVIEFTSWSSNTTSYFDQTPVSARTTATGVVEYWVGRMVGYALSDVTMNALITDQSSAARGAPAAARSPDPVWREQAFRRLVSLIATSEEFSYR
jgi:uncharacterized protein (DUF1800 family)